MMVTPWMVVTVHVAGRSVLTPTTRSVLQVLSTVQNHGIAIPWPSGRFNFRWHCLPRYAVQMGATISNNGWGGGFSQTLYDSIAAAQDADHIFLLQPAMVAVTVLETITIAVPTTPQLQPTQCNFGCRYR